MAIGLLPGRHIQNALARTTVKLNHPNTSSKRFLFIFFAKFQFLVTVGLGAAGYLSDVWYTFHRTYLFFHVFLSVQLLTQNVVYSTDNNCNIFIYACSSAAESACRST